MTHTPGPWVVKFNTDNQTAAIEPSKELLAQGRGGIAHVYKKDPLDEGYANQRLIAAAPDMLAALELGRNLKVKKQGSKTIYRSLSAEKIIADMKNKPIKKGGG